MNTHYRDLLAFAHKRPRAYLLDDTFTYHVAFIEGVNAGTGGHLLSSFREFLLIRIGQPDNLAWPGLVRWLTEPVGPKRGGFRGLPPADDQAAVARTYELLDEFLALRQSFEGETRIHGEYLALLRQQGWSYEGWHGRENLAAAIRAIDNSQPRHSKAQDPDYMRNDQGEPDQAEPQTPS